MKRKRPLCDPEEVSRRGMAAMQNGAEVLQGLRAGAGSSASVFQQSHLETSPLTDDRLRESNPDEGQDSREMLEELCNYLKLTKDCVDAVHSMSTPKCNNEHSPKFNNEQCEYLFEKLNTSFDGARSFIEEFESQPTRMIPISGKERWAQTFRLLMVSGKRVMHFFEECSKDAWIQTSMILGKVAEYVLYVGMNLELCKLAFSEKGVGTQTLTMDEVDKLYANEMMIVQKKALVDANALLAMVVKEEETLVGQDLELARYLMFKLNGYTVNPSFAEKDPNIIMKMYEWVKNKGERVEQIGKGSFGTVYKTEWFGIPVAKKTFDGPNVQGFLREVKVWAQLCHPNITSMFCCNMTKRECSIVMELMDGNLHDLLESGIGEEGEFLPFPPLEGLDLMLQVGEGVEYLHGKGIVHRDLKSHNILMKKVVVPETGDVIVALKVADFGESKMKETSVAYTTMSYNFGSSRWMAPEVIKLKRENHIVCEKKSPKYNFKSDIYSLGMVFMEILTGEVPFSNIESERDVKKMVLENKRPLLPKYCNPGLGELIKKCCSQEPKERPSIGAICLELKYIKCSLLMSGISQGCPSLSMSELRDEIDAMNRHIRTMIARWLKHYDKGSKAIICNVSDKADHVSMNKNQCKWLARRFQQMGHALENAKTTSWHLHAWDRIGMLLQKGETLVDGYKGRYKALANALARGVNQKAFNEIHELLDHLKSVLYWSDDENVTQEVAAQNDLNTIIQDLDNLNLNEEPDVNMSDVKRVILDRVHQDAVPDYDMSYLHIPMSAIVLGPPIKPLPALMNMRDVHLEELPVFHKGTWNGCEYAIEMFMSSDRIEAFQKVIPSLVKLRHPHITQVIGCAQDEEKTYVLYEMMDGDLRDLMQARFQKTKSRSRPFDPLEEWSIVWQIAKGVFCLHQQGIVHGELKCTNVLVKKVDKDIDVKLSGFHRSRELGSNERYKPRHRARWLPPEAFGHFDLECPPAHDVLKQGDVYSFAMTCYEVLTGDYPFDLIRGDDVIKEMVLKGTRPKLPYNGCDDLNNLIAECWSEKPEDRPTFEEICYSLQLVFLSWIKRTRSSFSGSPETGSAAAVLPDNNQAWLKLTRESTSKASGEPERVVEGLPCYLNIQPTKLKRLKELGRGDSAQVWEVTWIGFKLAAKYLESDHVSKLRHEVDMRMKLLHPHVVRLVGFAAEGNRCAIVMELMEQSLRDFMNEKTKEDASTPFSEAEAIAIMTKLALGMDFMHSQGVAHGDLKCANVLVRHLESMSEHNILDVKLVDFNLAHLGSVVDTKPHIVGQFRAPEVIRSMKSKTPPYDLKAADVFSFGLMCLEIIIGKLPFYDIFDGLAEARSLAQWLERFEVRDELWNLLRRCWSEEPERRPKFPEICTILTTMSPKPRES